MAITAESMKERYLAGIAGITQTSDAAEAAAAADTVILALFAAIVDEIHENATVTGADSHGDSHNLAIL